MNPEWFKSQRVLQCLGDESRFRVMTELVRGNRCVTEIAALVGLSQSCTTRHLQVLERAGLVSSQRFGKRVVFCVRDEPRVVSLLAWALSMDAEGDITRPSPGESGRLQHFEESGSRTASKAPERPRVLELVRGTNENNEARPEDRARSERVRPRELEDFLL